MRVKIASVLFFLFASFACRAQQDSISLSRHIDFLIYLYENGQLPDFDYAGNGLLSKTNLTIDQRDSVNYILGFGNFSKAKYGRSLQYLKEVTANSSYYYKSRFYLAICHSENKQFDSAYCSLSTVDAREIGSLVQLQCYEMAAFSLLKRNYATYDSLALQFNSTDSLLASEQKLLNLNQQKLRTLKRKSPLVAGTLSAIVPGLGLVYSGNNGQALAAFIRVAAMGALAVEQYVKKGPDNAQFIIFSSLFSFFYIGNIWGSTLSVKIRYDENVKEIDHNVMVGLRIPVDHFFR